VGRWCRTRPRRGEAQRQEGTDHQRRHTSVTNVRKSTKDTSGKFRFRLKASNGQVVATGEAYETKASALNGIESVKKNSAGAKTDDQTD